MVKLSPHPQLPFEFGLLNTNSDLRKQRIKTCQTHTSATGQFLVTDFSKETVYASWAESITLSALGTSEAAIKVQQGDHHEAGGLELV